MIRTFATRSNALRALKDISIAAVVHASVLITETPDGKFSFRESQAEQYLTEQEEITSTLNTQESIMNVQTATTVELVAFYNAHTEAQIKKFRDRATAEKKVQAILDAQTVEPTQEVSANDKQLLEQYGTTICPSCGINLDNGVGIHEDDVNGKHVVHTKTHEYWCMACNAEFGPLLPGKKERTHAVSETQAETMKTSLKLVRTITCLDTQETWKNAFQMWKARTDWMTSGQQDRLTAKLYAAAKEGRYEVVEINGRKFQLVGA